MRKAIAAIPVLLLAGCSFMYARLTYDFSPLPENRQILHEPGAEDLAKMVAKNFATSVERVEQKQYAPFKNIGAIRIYVFNDRRRYANYSHASISTRGSSTTNEVYLSEKLRERIDTLPSILVHELSHVHIRQYTGTFEYVKDIPGWFLEGVAVSVSSGGGAENVTAERAQTAMRNRIRFEPDDSGRIIGHRTAHDYDLEPHMYYRQAGLFVEYLNRTSPQGFEAALLGILRGGSFQAAWRKHYDRDISELWRGYERSIEAQRVVPTHAPAIAPPSMPTNEEQRQ